MTIKINKIKYNLNYKQPVKFTNILEYILI